MSGVSARLACAATVLLMLTGCAGESNVEADIAGNCSARGLTPGSDAFANCIERLHLEKRLEEERIRQARELSRGSSKL